MDELAEKPVVDIFIGGPADSSHDNFTGIIRDVTIFGNVLIPRDTVHAGVVIPQHEHVLGDVVVGASTREEQCNTTSCGGLGRGVCVDLWTESSCDCHTQFYGEVCEHGMFPLLKDNQNLNRLILLRENIIENCGRLFREK